ncbi:uncharacterized protein LOC135091965 [Scylla paramamosain]|uniref:uncharacterized protein LOC135091965 n=1 Tax=Scylla paramamosain TaxID=85552 RepID=UPI00308308F0
MPEGRAAPHPSKRLLRSQSLPAYSGVRGPQCAAPPQEAPFHGQGDSGPPESSDEAPRRRRDTRATIMQHYYPEGGWGWVVVAVAAAVHLLAHGLHTAYGALLGLTLANFSTQQPVLVGECLLGLPAVSGWGGAGHGGLWPHHLLSVRRHFSAPGRLFLVAGRGTEGSRGVL